MEAIQEASEKKENDEVDTTRQGRSRKARTRHEHSKEEEDEEKENKRQAITTKQKQNLQAI